MMMAGFHPGHFFTDRVQLELADEQLEPLALEQDLAARRGDVVAFVDEDPVDADRDPVALAGAFHPGPLALGALDVVPAPGVEQSPGSPGRAATTRAGPASKAGACPPASIGAAGRARARTSPMNWTGIVWPSGSTPGIGIRSPTHPWASWHSTEAIQVPSAPPSGPVAFRRMPGVADGLAAVGPLAPSVLDDHPIVAIGPLGGEVAEAVAGDVELAVVGDAEDAPGVVAAGILEPGREAGEVLAVEEADDLARAFGGGRRVVAAEAGGSSPARIRAQGIDRAVTAMLLGGSGKIDVSSAGWPTIQADRRPTLLTVAIAERAARASRPPPT